MFIVLTRTSEILCNIKLTLIFSAIFLSSCSAVMPSTPLDSVKASLFIQWAEPHEIHFQGKGIGAGIALMSTMGAMGMAIGVAIDEGISKQLTQTQLASNKQLKNILIQQAGDVFFADYDVQWDAHRQFDSKQVNSNYIVIEKIGFRLKPGHADGVCGEVKIKITSEKTAASTFHYPNDIHASESQINASCAVYELEKLKIDKEYLNQALSDVLGQAFLMLTKHTAPI